MSRTRETDLPERAQVGDGVWIDSLLGALFSKTGKDLTIKSGAQLYLEALGDILTRSRLLLRSGQAAPELSFDGDLSTGLWQSEAGMMHIAAGSNRLTISQAAGLTQFVGTNTSNLSGSGISNSVNNLSSIVNSAGGATLAVLGSGTISQSVGTTSSTLNASGISNSVNAMSSISNSSGLASTALSDTNGFVASYSARSRRVNAGGIVDTADGNTFSMNTSGVSTTAAANQNIAFTTTGTGIMTYRGFNMHNLSSFDVTPGSSVAALPGTLLLNATFAMGKTTYCTINLSPAFPGARLTIFKKQGSLNLSLYIPGSTPVFGSPTSATAIQHLVELVYDGSVWHYLCYT